MTNKYNLSKFTQIKRTIETLQDSYPHTKILDKETIVRCLNDNQFQSKYVQY